ncbi:retrovirus-related pol polyprotein from transposon TNT 1-94 [Tanacetum coccineum]
MDSILSLGQKNTLAEYIILSDANNHPPMLDKDLYDSWKSRMELYMQNREHGRMIVESFKHGPLIWPTVKDNGVIKTKKYAELSAAKKIQAEATNIILQGLLADIYSLVNHHRVAKDLWERMKMKQFQVNTKFLNSLPPEWSKFVTDVKLVKDLHTSNFDQLHAYLEQHELHANEVRIMRERNQDPLAFVANQQMTPPHFNPYQSSYNNPQLQQQFSPSQYGSIQHNQHYSSTYPSQPQFNHSSIPPSHTYQSQMNHQTSSVPQAIPQVAYQSPPAPTQPMTESPFFVTQLCSLLPIINSELLNPRNQATIKTAGLTAQGEILQVDKARQCNKEKAMLAKAQEAGHILDEEQLAFLVDPRVSDCDESLDCTSKFLMANISTYGSDVISEKAQRIKPTLYDGVVMSNTHAMPMIDDEETLILEEESQSKMFEKAKDPEIYFEINDLKAQLQDKDKTICKLKDTIKYSRENTKEENINRVKYDLEPINKELENSVAKLLSENERKEIVENVVHTPSVTTIAPGMFKLDLVPLPHRLLQNRDAHIDYLRHTQEQANTLREIVEQAKAKQPLERDPKKVAITPMNKVKKVRFAEPLTSSSNIKHVESSNTSDSNTPVLSSTGVKCSTICGSKPPGNKKNDRISQTSSRNKKKKVEAQPRKVVQIVLWYLDSGCSKHMTGNRSQLMNFVSKFLGTVRFGNDQIARIMGYGDYQLGNVIISRVYYVEGLGHNLFSVGQFCDADLEVAFWKNTCFIRNLEGVDLLSGSRDTNLYTISLDDMLKSSLICLLSKASKTKTCALEKSKKSSHQPKAEDTNQEKLYLLHIDLCGPMRVASTNGKRYILVIVDDYSRFYWVGFLKTKDEAPATIIECIKNIQVRLNATIQNVRTDNRTEFINQTLREWYENVGITHQTFIARTPQQNGVVERRNQTLVEAAQTMLIFSKAPLFL